MTVSNNTTFSKVAMMPEMQSKYGNVAGNVDSWGPIVNSDYDPRDFFRTGSNVINSVALSTGNQKNQSYLSASTTNTTNILPNSGYNRYNFTVRNTTSFLKDKMTLDAGASYILQNDKIWYLKDIIIIHCLDFIDSPVRKILRMCVCLSVTMRV